MDVVMLPGQMMGGVRGRSTLLNAKVHMGASCLVRLDIRGFFGNTKGRMVRQAWRRKLGCIPDVADLLTALVTLNNALPEGASTSSPMANIVIVDLAHDLQAIAEALDLRFTIYVDDILFSGDRAREAIEPAARAVTRHGYSLSRRKIEVMPRHSALQLATGFVVNSGRLTIERGRIQKVEDELYRCARMPLVGDKQLASLRGKIRHIASVQEACGAYLEKRAKELVHGF